MSNDSDELIVYGSSFFFFRKRKTNQKENSRLRDSSIKATAAAMPLSSEDSRCRI